MAGGKRPEEVEREELAAAVFEGEKLERTQRRVLEMRIRNALQRTRRDTIEECARVADSFTCGSCGMDGKAGTAIRNLKD